MNELQTLPVSLQAVELLAPQTWIAEVFTPERVAKLEKLLRNFGWEVADRIIGSQHSTAMLLDEHGTFFDPREMMTRVSSSTDFKSNVNAYHSFEITVANETGAHLGDIFLPQTSPIRGSKVSCSHLSWAEQDPVFIAYRSNSMPPCANEIETNTNKADFILNQSQQTMCEFAMVYSRIFGIGRTALAKQYESPGVWRDYCNAISWDLDRAEFASREIVDKFDKITDI